MPTAPVEVGGGALQVYASAGAEARARTIAQILEHAHGWLSEVLGFRPRVTLHVLGPEDWAATATVPTYGMPHTHGGDSIVIAGDPSRLFDEIRDVVLREASAGPRAQLFQVYGDPPDLSSFTDLLSVHELAHLFHEQVPFDFPELWIRELFCNVALQGYVIEALPAAQRVLETLPRACREVRAERMPVHELGRMDEAFGAGGGLNYGWFQLQLHHAAIGLWEAGGHELLETMYERFRDAPVARTVDLRSIHPALERVPSEWPA